MSNSSTPTAAAGWYPDPAGSARSRWWDGTQWTEHYYDPATGVPVAQLKAPEGTKVYNLWIWLVVFLPYITLPFLFLIFFTIIQGTMVLQAGNAAQSVASAAYNAARLYGASDGDGVTAGNALLGDLGSTLTNAQVVVERNGQTVTVTVTGQAASLVPGVPLDVERTVYGPTERWVE